MADTYKRLRNDGQYDDIEWRELLHTLDANGYAVAASAANPMPVTVTGSGVPGTPVAQPTVTASTTASAIISLSQPAKGVRLVVVNKDAGTATTPTAADGYFNVVFDPPSDLIKADWLNETLAGPRHRVTTKQALEIYFQDSAGTALTVSTFAHAASQTNANISLAVEAIV